MAVHQGVEQYQLPDRDNKLWKKRCVARFAWVLGYFQHQKPDLKSQVSDFLLVTWVFPKIVVPQNGWFIRENLIKMDDLGVHPLTS